MKKIKHLLGLIAIVVSFNNAHTQSLIHYWNFNDNATILNLLSPNVSLVSGAAIIHNAGGISEIDNSGGTGQDFDVNNFNARNGDPAGAHLRFNDPIGGELEFALPTTGYTNIVVSFATRRSGSGAGVQYWSYTVDGSNYTVFDSIFPSSAGPEFKTLHFAGVEDVPDNANFKIRVAFAEGTGGTGGNNRFDNFTVDGDATSELVHYWNFNDISTYQDHITPSFTLGGAQLDTLQFPGGSSLLAHENGTNSDLDMNLNARNGDSAGTHLRFNNPVFGALIFTLPTTGKENIVVKYASVRSGSGAHQQFVEYTTDGINYVLYDTMFPEEGTNQQLFVVDLRDEVSVNDNPDFKIKITFGQGGGGLAGNNRIDNFTLESIAPNLTGAVTGVSVSPKEILLVVGDDETIVATVSPVDAIDPSVMWSSSDATIAAVDSTGNVVAIGEGTAMIYATTNDGGFVDSASVMVVEPSELELIYYWHFNTFNPAEDVTEIDSDYSLLFNVTGKFTYTLTPDTGVINERDIDRYSSGSLLNAQMGEASGSAARVRNPSVNRSLVFDVPTDGIANLVFTLTVQRSNNGMQTNTVDYSVDGVNFISTGLINNVQDVLDSEVWQIHSYDFTSIAEANDNPDFKIRITWTDANASNNSGNNRYDNITLMGDASNVSVPRIAVANPVSVYPNPNSGFITVGTINNRPVQYVSIIDVHGRIVLESTETSLNLTALNNGVYFVMTMVDGVTYKQKIVVNQ